MENKEFLKDFNLTGDIKKDDQMIWDAFGLDSPDKIVVYHPKRREKTNISPRGYYWGFLNENWKQISLPDKLRVMHWQQKSFLGELGYAKPIPNLSFFTENDYSHLSYIALCFKDRIVFKLDNLEYSNGISAYTTLLHECIHLADYEKYEQLRNKYRSYIKSSPYLDKVAFCDELMALPINGQLTHSFLGNKVDIDAKMRDEILLLKNLFLAKNGISPQSLADKDLNTGSKYTDFVNDNFYRLSPMEYRAYTKSLQATNTFCRLLNPFEVNEQDIDALNKAKNRYAYFKDLKTFPEKNFNMTYEEFVNTEMINKYNVSVHEKSEYICPDIMAKRARVIKENKYELER